jgi:hypothetical protein
VRNTSKKGKTVKSAPKVIVGHKRAPETKSKKPANLANPLQPKPKELAVLPQSNQSLTEEISDLLDNLPLNAHVELTCRILTSVPILPFEAARSRAVLKTVVLFIAEYGSMALEDMDFAVGLLEC